MNPWSSKNTPSMVSGCDRHHVGDLVAADAVGVPAYRGNRARNQSTVISNASRR